MAPRKPTGTALVNWDEELAAEAKVAAGMEATTGGSFVSLKSGVLSYNGAQIPGNKMNAVILDHVFENQFYTGKFEPDSPQSPVCYAFGRVEEEMAPHEKSEAPQHDQCTGCPMNEWGSADVGKGKACKNVRRLALVPESALEDLDGAAVAYLKLPVTSVKGWSGYVQQLSQVVNRPPHAVITEISVVPDAASQFKVQFKLVDKITDGETLMKIRARRPGVQEGIVFAYPPNPEEAPQPKRGGRAAPATKAAPKGRKY